MVMGRRADVTSADLSGLASFRLHVEPGIGQTALVGEIRDQSHLYGVLDLVRERGLGLVSVKPN